MNKLMVSSLCLSILVSIHAMEWQCTEEDQCTDQDILQNLRTFVSNPDINDQDLWNEARGIVGCRNKQIKQEALDIILNQLEEHQKQTSFVNKQDEDGKTLLHYAAELGAEEVVNKLLVYGANNETIDKRGYKASDFARVIDEQVGSNLAQYLEKHSILSQLQQFILDKNNQKVVEILEKYPDIVNKQIISDHVRLNPPSLFVVAAQGNLKACKLLVKCKADVNISENQSGETPLHVAGTAGVVQYLVDHMADPNAKTTHTHQTPLHTTAFWGKSDVVKCLLENNADQGIKDYTEKTPYEHACEWYNVIKTSKNHSIEEINRCKRTLDVFGEHAAKKTKI